MKFLLYCLMFIIFRLVVFGAIAVKSNNVLLWLFKVFSTLLVSLANSASFTELSPWFCLRAKLALIWLN